MMNKDKQVSQEEKREKNIALTSYFTFVGTLIAWSMNTDKKDPFASFHIRQNIGLNLSWLLIFVILSGFNNYLVQNQLPFLEENPNFIFLILVPFYFVFALFWGYSFIGALGSKCLLLPIVGKLFQKWFHKVA